jgi:hypothetical protein
MRPLGARPLGRFGRPRRRLRTGLLQLLCALAGLVVGLLLPRITAESTVASTRVTETLVAVGFGVLGLVTIIFSLLFLVVQWAFGSLSPRLNLFPDDPIVWRTFGLAIGVFVFSVTTALVIGDQEKVSVIVPAAGVVAVLAALALIRSLQAKAFASIRPSSVPLRDVDVDRGNQPLAFHSGAMLAGPSATWISRTSLTAGMSAPAWDAHVQAAQEILGGVGMPAPMSIWLTC